MNCGPGSQPQESDETGRERCEKGQGIMHPGPDGSVSSNCDLSKPPIPEELTKGSILGPQVICPPESDCTGQEDGGESVTMWI